jgi:hypothetical protein
MDGCNVGVSGRWAVDAAGAGPDEAPGAAQLAVHSGLCAVEALQSGSLRGLLDLQVLGTDDLQVLGTNGLANSQSPLFLCSLTGEPKQAPQS